MTNHVLKFDGYSVGDRLLEGAMFDVHIEETDTDLVIGEIGPSEESASYLEQINVKIFIPEIRKEVQENIDHLRKSATERGERWPTELLDNWEREWPTFAEPGETYSRIDVVTEV